MHAMAQAREDREILVAAMDYMSAGKEDEEKFKPVLVGYGDEAKLSMLQSVSRKGGSVEPRIDSPQQRTNVCRPSWRSPIRLHTCRRAGANLMPMG